MANPPFNLDITHPGDNDYESVFPANERAFRDNVNSYLNTEHNPNTGSHLFHVVGQCKLSVQSTTSLVLFPYGGNAVTNNGGLIFLPAGGVVATSTSTYVSGVVGQALAASTLYLAYLFSNAGVPTLDFWPQSGGHMQDTTPGNIGVEVRNNGGSPDSTRTLVGMVYMDASAHFQSNQQQRFLANWFERKLLVLVCPYVSQGTASTTLATLPNTTFSGVFWGDEVITVTVGNIVANAVACYITYQIWIDGANWTGTNAYITTTGVGAASLYFSGIGLFGEGFHTFLLKASTNAGTATINSSYQVQLRE